MIKLFRRIRQKLLSENKLSQYIIYAIGEIILVVIGILIALQINNWNVDRIERETAYEYLQSLTADLKLDEINFNDYNNFLEEHQNRKRVLLERLKYDDLSTDSLVTLIQPFLLNKKIVDETFHKLNIEKFSKHIDEDLFFKINKYYTTTSIRYLSFVSWDEEYTLKESEFWYYNPSFETTYLDEKFPFIQNDAEQRKMLIDQISSVKGRNMLRIYLFRKKRIQKFVNDFKAEANSLHNEIDAYLVSKR
ncbi:hypothetical protein SAMN04487906_1916 [Zhouia amylolytica]|uniref:Uncharacterized protein n=1 Tax=Zhouia amylolytica TaxID=376730 RepID=A0A1I6T933_9FLAO|nr:DUF6090 family protein [Zhouia amylolytica]MCQ0112613.1 hypothetical protein [Zhouia amylolytica]SFS85588.1 hypothetical protein SAMN04487906_1916 [Zhouia amylolytica]